MYCWILPFLVFLPSSQPLIGYDCGSSSAQMTTISLKEVAECPVPSLSYTNSKMSINVFQRKEYVKQHVWTYQIEITRLITYCGMYSHSSVVSGGLKNILHRVGGEECKLMHRDGTIRLYGNTIGGIKSNSTITASVTALGQLDNTGKCVGANYQEDGYTWENVVITAGVTITVKDFLATVNLNENTISILNGVSCQFPLAYRLDAEIGEAVWETAQPESCEGHLSLLYQGEAGEVVERRTNTKYLVVETQEKVFAVTLVKQTRICGEMTWQTEHPRIIITPKEQSFNTEILTAEDVDLMTYINSKFLYVEQSYKKEIDRLYTDTIHRRCLLQRETLKNRLMMALILPDTISLLIQEKEGYVGRVLGEVLYVLKCTPIPVEIRRESRCYNEIPVLVHNQSKFMSPFHG